MEIKVLDHGFVRLRNVSGPTRRVDLPMTTYAVGEKPPRFDADDTDPANAARLSFDNLDANRAREEDLKLCHYLMKNKHTSPFEMIEVWLEMKLPIFVARQFVRHRTVSLNEVSARYVQLPREWYMPQEVTVGFRPTNVKQGRQLAWTELTPEQKMEIQNFLANLWKVCSTSYECYEQALAAGIAPELARCFLHVNHYTHWLWKQDLHNLMHFLSLRIDSHAQWEAQQYGKAIYDLLFEVLPHSMSLFDQYRRMG